MINKIWGLFIIIGILYALMTGNSKIINEEILNSCKTSLEMTLKLFPVIALWLGIMNIAKTSGLLNKLSKLISPLLKTIFPEIPNGHESLSLISSNVIANMFGKVASKSMITFLVLNTSGLTIIPTTIISLRMMHGSNNPTEIVLACLIATIMSTTGGLIINKILASRDKNV